MKKIGLITIHNWFNYGSMLQSYALNRVLNEIDGYECELIDFTPASIVGNERSWRLYSDVPEYQELRKKYKKEIVERRNVFQKFEELYKMGDMVYQSDEEIEKNPPAYDIYITGSDQIWNVNFRIASRAYFLAFTDSQEKFAFSTSIGRCKKEPLEEYRRFMEQYKKIYIREKAGAELLSEMFPEKEIGTLIDPTLMLEKSQWQELVDTQRICEEEYIGCYATLEEDLNKMMPILKYLYEKYNKKIILFGMILPREEEWVENLIVAGPLEFIRIIRDADLILTNSYHGTLFSLMFQTPFFTFNDEFENPRKEGILRMVHQEKRMVHNLVECQKALDDVIDFSMVRCILGQEREVALKKIKEVL